MVLAYILPAFDSPFFLPFFFFFLCRYFNFPPFLSVLGGEEGGERGCYCEKRCHSTTDLRGEIGSILEGMPQA